MEFDELDNKVDFQKPVLIGLLKLGSPVFIVAEIIEEFEDGSTVFSVYGGDEIGWLEVAKTNKESAGWFLASANPSPEEEKDSPIEKLYRTLARVQRELLLGEEAPSEKEPNNSIDKAHEIRTPIVIDGRINPTLDLDCFRFQATAGCDRARAGTGVPYRATLAGFYRH